MIQIEPIGTVTHGRMQVEDDQWGNSESCIVLDERFEADALSGLSEFSHLEILFHFHEVSPEKIQNGMRHPRNNPDWPAVGIFAQRGKNRPNRLGTTICRFLRQEGRALWVAELDAIQGTPIVDIKPVMREFLPRNAVKQALWATELMRHYWD